MMGDADSFIAVKARWLMRREPGLRAGSLSLLDYGCGAGDLMRVLAGMGARATFMGCDVSVGMLAEAARRWPATIGPAPGLAFLAPVDRALAWRPLGAQYAVAARKPS